MISLKQHTGADCALHQGAPGAWHIRIADGTVIRHLNGFENALVCASFNAGIPVSAAALSNASALLSTVEKRLAELDLGITNYAPRDEYGLGFANGLRWAHGRLVGDPGFEPLTALSAPTSNRANAIAAFGVLAGFLLGVLTMAPL